MKHISKRLAYLAFAFSFLVLGMGILNYWYYWLESEINNVVTMTDGQVARLNKLAETIRYAQSSSAESAESFIKRVRIEVADLAKEALVVDKKLAAQEEALNGKIIRQFVTVNIDEMRLTADELRTIELISLLNSPVYDSIDLREMPSIYTLETRTLARQAWRTRIRAALLTTNQEMAKTQAIQYGVLIATFGLLVIVFMLMFRLGIFPLFHSLAQQNARTGHQLEVKSALISILNAMRFGDFEKLQTCEQLEDYLRNFFASHKPLRALSVRVSKEELSLEDPSSSLQEKIEFLGGAYLTVGKGKDAANDNTLDNEAEELQSIDTTIRSLANILNYFSATSSQIRAEKERDQYLSLTQRLLQSMANPVALVDSSENVIISNPAFNQIIGEHSAQPSFAITEISSELESRLFRKEDSGGLVDFFRSKKDGEKAFELDDRSVHLWSKRKISGLGRLFVAQDITQPQKLLHDIEHQNRLQTIGRLSGMVSHDINNFLSVIMNSLELIRDESLSFAEKDGLLEQAIGTCFQASKLNRELLSYSRRQNLKPNPVDTLFIEDYAKDFLHALKLKKTTLKTVINTGRNIVVDPTYFKTALGNILKNASEAMPKGGVITLSISNYTEKTIAISISDEGQGFTESGLKHAAEPFFSTKSDGTGFGLAAVEGFIRQSNGQLILRNLPKRGAEVVLILPSANPVKKKAEMPIKNDRPPVQSKKILLIEDNLQLANLIVAYLSQYQHKINVTHLLGGVHEQLEENEPYDIILSDVIVGANTCFESMSEIITHSPDALRVYMTGYGTENFTEYFKKFPGELLEKPFKMESLNEVISRHFLVQEFSKKKPALVSL